MKYFKQNFLIGFVILFTGLALSSCKDEEKENDELNGLSELVGTWVCVSNYSSISVTYEYVFSSDNRYTWSVYGVVYETGTYTLAGNKIICEPEDEYIADTILDFKYTGSKYIIYEPDTKSEYIKK